MAGTELLRRTGKVATLPDQYVLLWDRTIRRPIDDEDWLWWKTWSYILDWRRVALTETDEWRVSTVFLDMDHDTGMLWTWVQGEDGWPMAETPVGYQPLVFETMVFGKIMKGRKQRYRTWQDAEEGHRAMVDQVTRAYARAHARRLRRKKTT